MEGLPRIRDIVVGLAAAAVLAVACGDEEPESLGTTTTAVSIDAVQATTTTVSTHTTQITTPSSTTTTIPMSQPTSTTHGSSTSTSTSSTSAARSSTSASTTTSPPPSDAGLIAYWSSRELWLMDADGTDQRLVPTPIVLESGPVWSPDGTRLAFTGWDPDVDHHDGLVFDLWSVSSDGSEPVQVTSMSKDSVTSFAWSPDGMRFVYATTEWDLWTINVDGTGRRRITDDDAHQNLPAWSPDGSSIVYEQMAVVDRIVSGESDLWVSSPDGRSSRRLTTLGSATEPAWSVDGNRIAFVRYDFSQEIPDDHSDVWIVNADGSGLQNLTNEPTRFDLSPAWSPDGNRIAFHSAGPIRFWEDPEMGLIQGHDPPADIFVISADGGPRTQLTFGDQSEAAPSWRP